MKCTHGATTCVYNVIHSIALFSGANHISQQQQQQQQQQQLQGGPRAPQARMLSVLPSRRINSQVGGRARWEEDPQSKASAQGQVPALVQPQLQGELGLPQQQLQQTQQQQLLKAASGASARSVGIVGRTLAASESTAAVAPPPPPDTAAAAAATAAAAAAGGIAPE